MRFVILLGLLMVATCINKEEIHTNADFFYLLLGIMLIWDLIDSLFERR